MKTIFSFHLLFIGLVYTLGLSTVLASSQSQSSSPHHKSKTTKKAFSLQSIQCYKTNRDLKPNFLQSSREKLASEGNCPFCKASFIYTTSKEQHIHRQHQARLQPKCAKCTRSFPSLQALQQHQGQTHCYVDIQCRKKSEADLQKLQQWHVMTEAKRVRVIPPCFFDPKKQKEDIAIDLRISHCLYIYIMAKRSQKIIDDLMNIRQEGKLYLTAFDVDYVWGRDKNRVIDIIFH